VKLSRRQLFGAVLGLSIGTPVAAPARLVSREAVRDRVLRTINDTYERMVRQALATADRARPGRFTIESIFAGKEHLSRRVL
jgi:hypothetical protein